MNPDKQSRRKFIGMNFWLMGVPSVIYSLIPLRGNAITTLKNSGYNFKSGNNVPDLVRIQELLGQKNPIKWIFTGDSITAGVKHTQGYRSYPEIFGERIRWEMARPRDIVVNTAISGNTTQNILDDFNWRVGQFKPDVVSLMIGTNDCVRKDMPTEIFEGKLNVLLDKIRETGAVPILHTPNVIITEYARERTGLPGYVAMIQKTAENKDMILVDNYSYWEDVIKSNSGVNVFKEWLNDPVHPNGAGHLEIARLLFKALSIFDPKDPTCNGNYYEGKH
jgi:lysophospholipase L1-like esterase